MHIHIHYIMGFHFKLQQQSGQKPTEVLHEALRAHRAVHLVPTVFHNGFYNSVTIDYKNRDSEQLHMIYTAL